MDKFKRKAFDLLKDWKENYAPNYAALLEGARRVGKSTIAEEFAKKNYRSYIKVDFAHIDDDLLSAFKDIAKLDVFFLRLQTITGVNLYPRESVIIFDEIQLNPKTRQAIKYLVADGRYDYIEFMWAIGNNTYDVLRQLYKTNAPAGNGVNRSLMRDFRIYMAVGGMPQAVQAYVDGKNFSFIDRVKRGIIDLYIDDFKKIDNSGLIGMMYKSIPSQLATQKKRYVISKATKKRTTKKDLERLSDLLDSKTVIPCYNTTDPNITLSQTQDNDTFKLYLSDVGLFTTMIFEASSNTGENIYSKLLSDKLPADLGYLYENAAAQIIASTNRTPYYYTWEKKGSTHYYEVDFLLQSGTKVIPVEVKSSSNKNHESIDAFCEKYSNRIGRPLLISQKDVGNEGQLMFKPVYMLPFVLEEL